MKGMADLQSARYVARVAHGGHGFFNTRGRTADYGFLAAVDIGNDHIIIDSPPILAVTDATIIGQMVGGTLMVLKAGEHPMREIELAAKRLRHADVNLRGILFNDINLQSQRYGAGKYSYQYTYKKRPGSE